MACAAKEFDSVQILPRSCQEAKPLFLCFANNFNEAVTTALGVNKVDPSADF